MIKLKLKETDESVQISVGDLILTKCGPRLIVGPYGKYFGVNAENMKICGTFDSLKEVEMLYCKGDYRIIKSENLTLVEE